MTRRAERVLTELFADDAPRRFSTGWIDERAVLAYLGFVSFHAVFIHANFAPRWPWLERWLVMPRFHHWHHGIEPEARDVNFAVHLPVLDRLFGTQHLGDGQWPSGYGVDGVRPPDGWLRQLLWPFGRR